jgi:hypothetical protein
VTARRQPASDPNSEASGLDLEGLTQRLRRTQTTVITAAVAIVLLYVGPLADVAGGVDLSTIGSAVIAGLLYVASGRFIKS